MSAFLFADQHPKDQIASVVEHHILPAIASMGFSFNKKELALIRHIGDFAFRMVLPTLNLLLTASRCSPPVKTQPLRVGILREI